MSPALQRPAFVGQDWWDSVLRVAHAALTKDELDRKVRRLTHDVYQAYQTIEGNALSRERKDQIHSLRRLSREVWRELHGGVEPPRPTRTLYVGYVAPMGANGYVDFAAFEAAGGKVRPAGNKVKLETFDANLAREWDCLHTEVRA
jgi:hypothetical protein